MARQTVKTPTEEARATRRSKDEGEGLRGVGVINEELAERVVRAVESDRGDATYTNDVQPGDQLGAAVVASTFD